MIHTYASLEHYAEHVAPIFDRLPDRLRGERWSARTGSWWGGHGGPLAPAADDVVMVASMSDYMRCEGWPVIYVEHGAGQTYQADPTSIEHGSYSGGAGLDRVRLFVCPSDQVAQRWQRMYPHARCVVAGSPKMDCWYVAPQVPQPRTVALTFHWDCQLIPETRGAWPFWNRALPALAQWALEHDVTLLGHAHPRLWPRIEARWRELGIEPVKSLRDVFWRAGTMVADNTSAMYEFASLGRPVLALNAPWWRRDVEHGMRFWSHVPGVQIDALDELVPAVALHVECPATGITERQAAVAAVYARCDGQAAARAVAGITEMF